MLKNHTPSFSYCDRNAGNAFFVKPSDFPRDKLTGFDIFGSEVEKVHFNFIVCLLLFHGKQENYEVQMKFLNF